MPAVDNTMLANRRFSAAAFVLAVLWTFATLAFLLAVSVLILTQPHFPLTLGIVKTIGVSGLWVTLLPAIVAAGGLLLWAKHRPIGAGLLSSYSFFWTAVTASGFPAIWNARRSFCLNSLNFCIISPWVGRLTLFGIVLPFLLSGVWFSRSITRTVHARVAATR